MIEIDDKVGTEEVQSRSPREKAVIAVAIVLGCFIFYTAAFGSFESLIQRSLFVGFASTLAVLLTPLGGGKSWRPIGIAVDIVLVSVIWFAVYSTITRFEEIMVLRPFAENPDVLLGAATLLVILELARRTVSFLFPLLVGLMVAYALLGDQIPGRFGHRGFDLYYVTETVFLSDLGLWGMLVGIASTTLAAFVLFGAFLLHTGAGKTFFDLAARASGSSPGGAAKIATIASGFFGMISGSTVANVATTGNFTIPLMRRLNYPRAYAGGVEAIASTGGQLAPPIMGTAAFVMAELVGMNYWIIAAAALIPAVLFYLGILLTVHVIASRRQFGKVDVDALPSWKEALDWRRIAPIVASLGGIIYGVLNGNSVETTAFYGIMAMIVAFIGARMSAGESLWLAIQQLAPAIVTGGKGVVIVGILLVAAQVFVALLNLTGVGVTLTSIILSSAGENIALIALVMAIVCLIAGMGLPTSAAYVLVAAVFAPALIQAGLPPLTVHFFVLYYATLSVITPPVCVGVFVASTICQERWPKVAFEAVRLGAVAYMLPILFIVYPGLLMQGSWAEVGQAAITGVTFTVSVAFLLGGQPIKGDNRFEAIVWFVPLALSVWPTWPATIFGVAALLGLIYIRSKMLTPAKAPSGA